MPTGGASPTLGIAYAFGMAVSWAVMGIVLRRIPSRLGVFLVNGLRALFGLLAVVLLVVATGRCGAFRLLSCADVLYLVGSILAGGVLGDVLYLSSLRLLGMPRCFPIINSYPLFTVILSVVLLGEQVSGAMIGGMLLVFAGIYLVARPRGTAGGGEAALPRRELIRGILMALAAAALYGIEGILVSLGVGGVDGIVANSVRVPVVVVLSLLLALRRGGWRQVQGLDRRTVGLLILGGALGWAVAGSFWVAAVRLAGPSKAAIIGSTAPLFAVPLSVVLLGEKPTRWTLGGTALTVVGIMLVV